MCYLSNHLLACLYCLFSKFPVETFVVRHFAHSHGATNAWRRTRGEMNKMFLCPSKTRPPSRTCNTILYKTSFPTFDRISRCWIYRHFRHHLIEYYHVTTQRPTARTTFTTTPTNQDGTTTTYPNKQNGKNGSPERAKRSGSFSPTCVMLTFIETGSSSVTNNGCSRPSNENREHRRV